MEDRFGWVASGNFGNFGNYGNFGNFGNFWQLRKFRHHRGPNAVAGGRRLGAVCRADGNNILSDPGSARSYDRPKNAPEPQLFPDAWWDPALRAQLVLAAFGKFNWETGIRLEPPDNSAENLRFLMEDLIKKRNTMRSLRFYEILGQANALDDCWNQLLGAINGHRPHVAQLVQIGIAVGQMVGMHFKNEHKRMRPIQVYPALMTSVPTPGHPSYPNNHSLQSHLIRHCVYKGMPPGAQAAFKDVLTAFAARVGENREIAGVHFKDDTEAGRDVAAQIFLKYLDRCPPFNAVCEAAVAEWQDLVAGPQPPPTPAYAISLPVMVAGAGGPGDKAPESNGPANGGQHHVR